MQLVSKDMSSDAAKNHDQVRGCQLDRDAAGAPTCEEWYHGRISEEEARRRLEQSLTKEDRPVALIYLVYTPPSRRGISRNCTQNDAEYNLLCFVNNTFIGWSITRRASDGKYTVGSGSREHSRGHDSVKKLIEYHSGRLCGKALPMEQERSGIVLGNSYCVVTANEMQDNPNGSNMHARCCCCTQ